MDTPDKHFMNGAAVKTDLAMQHHFKRTRMALTGPTGQYKVSEEARERFCYTSDGVLHVVHGCKAHPLVLAFMSRLDRANIAYSIQAVSYTELKGIYDASTELDGLDEVVDDAAQQQAILSYLKQAVREGASDIHIIPGRHPDSKSPGTLVDATLIRYRIDGELHTFHELPRSLGESLISTIYLTMCDLQEKLYNRHVNQNARLRQEFSRAAGLYVARVATGPTDNGQHCVIRLHHDNGHVIFSLEEMGYEPEQIADIDTMRRRGIGVSFFSGAVGSGKTTTLANVQKIILREASGLICLIMLEDPPETPVPGALQKPVPTTSEDEKINEQAWLDAMKHILRSDPNVVCVGEVRNAAAIKAVISIALTGRPTWTTIHAGNPIQILERLRDAEVDHSMLTDPTLVTGLVNQSLVRVLCPHCRVPFRERADAMPAGVRERIERFCKADSVYLRGDGCAHCRGGIRGRRVCAATIVPTVGFMRAYDQGGVLAAHEHWVKEMGGLTKCQHLLRLVNRGLVDPLLGERDAGVALDEDYLLFGELGVAHNQ